MTLILEPRTAAAHLYMSESQQAYTQSFSLYQPGKYRDEVAVNRSTGLQADTNRPVRVNLNGLVTGLADDPKSIAEVVEIRRGPGQGPFEFPAWPPEFRTVFGEIPGSRIRLALRPEPPQAAPNGQPYSKSG